MGRRCPRLPPTATAGSESRIRVEAEALPDSVSYEKDGLSLETVSALEEMGYSLRELPGYGASLSSLIADGEGWIGVADPRRGGGAAGF